MKRCVALALVVYSTLCVPIAAGTPGQTNPSTTIQEPTLALDHFIAACNHNKTATLTLAKGYVADKTGNCHPKNITTDVKTPMYILDKDCLQVGEFIIERDPGSSKIIGKDRTRYNLTCIVDDSRGYLASVSAKLTQVKEHTKSEKGQVTHPSISMELLSTDPSKISKFVEIKPITGDVFLGQPIYLTIYHNQTTNGQAYLFPQDCAAAGGKAPSLNLWNLNDSNSKCFFEPSVLSGGFQTKHVKDEIDFVFAEMKAFQFQADPTETITFSCSVRICGNNTAGNCHEDSLSLTTCGSRASGRRRRDVMDQDDSPVGQGSLHHVTATLHIRDDIMSTGMASRFRYTVSCLVLPLLAVFVM